MDNEHIIRMQEELEHLKKDKNKHKTETISSNLVITILEEKGIELADDKKKEIKVAYDKAHETYTNLTKHIKKLKKQIKEAIELEKYKTQDDKQQLLIRKRKNDDTLNYNSNMRHFLEDCLKMEYNRNMNGNTSIDTAQEKAVTDALETNLFENFEKCTDYNKTDFKRKNLEKWLDEPTQCPIPVGKFVYQPYSTQRNPDYLIRVSENQLMPLEAKSAKGMKPVYNSGGIDPGFLYLFSSKKADGFTFYMGSSIITQKQKSIIDMIIDEQKKIEKWGNDELKKCDTNERGTSYYTRPMIGQSGRKENTDYFNHSKRKECEKMVLDMFTA